MKEVKILPAVCLDAGGILNKNMEVETKALKINFNAEAAVTHTALLRNERAMNKSLLRISTGNRILSAADDAAGLFIADQLNIVAAILD